MKAVSKELQLVALAAGALALSMILPWYQKSQVTGREFAQDNLSALGAFTWIEAAILLVAVAVLFLVWARASQKGFHLPGGDGVAIMLAGAWAELLLVWRLFDKPNVAGAGVTMGIQWGIFVAMLAAGALIAAGARVRAAHRPEPPNPAADDVDWVAAPRTERERSPDRRPRDTTAVTEMLRDRPAWEGEPPDPSRAETTRLPDPSEAPTRRQRRPDEERTQRLFDDDSA
jgi:hypothetical protein